MGKLSSIVFIGVVALAALCSGQAPQQPLPQTKPAIVQPIQTKPNTAPAGPDIHFQNNETRPQPQASIFPILDHSSASAPADSHTHVTRDIPAQHQTEGNGSSPSAHDVTFTTFSEQTQDRQHNDPRFCTKIQQPICASNGRTYPNKCVFAQEQLTNPGLSVTRNGEC